VAPFALLKLDDGRHGRHPMRCDEQHVVPWRRQVRRTRGLHGQSARSLVEGQRDVPLVLIKRMRDRTEVICEASGVVSEKLLAC
jgi:hypothetical protein